MKTYLANLARRVAPRTVRNLEALSDLTADHGEGPLRFVAYERELQELRREVDALRRDNRRIGELYDAVFEWARRDAEARGVAPAVDQDRTDAAVAAFEEATAKRSGASA